MCLTKKENQNIEFKQSWRDEYIRWICGFANAEGGKLYIGIDDSGKITGIKNSKKLLTHIPNKTKDILGIIVDVSMKRGEGKEYLEISIESYPYPVSYKGEYHYRTGSTKQLLKGAALDRFLLGKQGRCWDGVPLPKVSASDLDKDAFELFINKALKSNRIDGKSLPKKYDSLLDKLILTENNFLKRAAILLFHKEPQRFITGCYIKIAYFQSESEIIYQDVIEGNLLVQTEKTFDLLFTKYLKALISYEGIQRIERFAYDPKAIREIVHNAIVHKDYSSGIPIQIGVFEDRLFVFNPGHLPQNWTVKSLTSLHRSIPFNPDIANVFFRAGLIESWGRGIEKVISSSRAYNDTVPVFSFNNGLNVKFLARYPNEDKISGAIGGAIGGAISGAIEVTTRQKEIIEIIKADSKISYRTIAEKLNINSSAVIKHLNTLKEKGILKRVGGTRGHWEVFNG
jgi:ATP-dependent DNA helicase RecG